MRRAGAGHGLGAGLGATVAMAAFLMSGVVRGTYPFGERSRAVNDLGNQFVPFHAHLWDLLHGTSSGDLFFNWNSAFGVPYWAEFVSFLGNPFSLLVAAFPRRLVDLAVYTGACLSIGLGSAVMVLWLRRLRPGPWWQAGLLGAAYGLSGWTLNDGAFDPMWLWGLTAFPLMLLALDRCTRERGWLWAAPMVGLAWAGNVYTSLMAVAGTAVVGVVLWATHEWSRTVSMRFAGRAALAFTLGTALAAPVIWPSYLAAANAQSMPVLPYNPPSPLEYLLQLLPAQRAFSSVPRFFVGMLALLLVLAFPLSRHIRARTRTAWCVALLAVAASFCWLPTVKVWYGLTQPNGSPYRATLVLTGLLVSVAWLCLAHRPRPGPLLTAGAVTCVIAAASVRDENGVSPLTWLVVLGSGGLTLALLLLLARERGGPLPRPLTAAALTAVVLAESAASAVAVDEQRDKLAFYAPKPTWGARHDAVYEAVARVDGWPAHRTDTGPAEIVNNDPQLLDSEGPSYYSSYLPRQTARLMQRLGYSWTMHGRHLIPQDNPVADAIFSVGARIRHADGPGQVRVERFPAPPLVTVQPRDTPRPPAGASTFLHQQAVLGQEVYELPRITFAGPDGAAADGPPRLRAGGPYRLTAAGGPYRITARCRPGSRLYVDGPWTDALLSGPGGKSVRLWGDYPEKATATKPLGTVPADGHVTVTVGKVFKDTELPHSPLGCLDPGKLRRGISELRARGATHVAAGGHSVRATLPAGSSGTAVVATARTPGWRCAVDGGPMRAPRSRLGLLAVPLPDASEHELHCVFRPPGLRVATAASASAAVLLLFLSAWRYTRGRRPAAGGDRSWRRRVGTTRTGSAREGTPTGKSL
ncbi:YfhO family protein [Streptomyces montanus]|uniref:YfhO family protein n=1 Tax=Streptomyces montanus TaxID=2580423 RepID=A0A5R9FU35_9ACTN|nr:YfhO family protein [Streptomyces montanus]TLS45400.1 YfhO family protein [Streptomyces montanus]